MTQCLCIHGHTVKLAKAALGLNPLAIFKEVRVQVFDWYAVENIDELMLDYPDAAYALSKFYAVLWLPIHAWMDEHGRTPNPTCDFCGGTGELIPYTRGYETWEEPLYGD